MSGKLTQGIFFSVIVLVLFSYWAAFALLVVNSYYYDTLPGYQIGRICIWELIAIIIACMGARYMIKNWGAISLIKSENTTKMKLDIRYGYFFLVYMIFLLLIGVWQFYIFSQSF